MFCDDTLYGMCDFYTIAYVIDDNVILCPRFWRNRQKSKTCDHQTDRGGILLHEMTHRPSLVGMPTKDHAYAHSLSFYSLDPELAVNNADSYFMFAKSEFSLSFFVNLVTHLGQSKKLT